MKLPPPEIMDVFDGPEQECFPLVDRKCVMLDGSCNCIREPNKSFPNCEKYPHFNP